MRFNLSGNMAYNPAWPTTVWRQQNRENFIWSPVITVMFGQNWFGEFAWGWIWHDVKKLEQTGTSDPWHLNAFNLNYDPEMATSLKRKNTTAELNMASPMFIFRDMITSVSMLGNSGSNSAKVKPPSHLSNLAMGNPELAMYDELLGPCGYGDQKRTSLLHTYIYMYIYIYIYYIHTSYIFKESLRIS